ncbi:MAG: HAD family hydrolase [Deltaproteobacteria bacterium]|nr:HAD family hydrolase [Deltaproteobacteria bacterium]
MVRTWIFDFDGTLMDTMGALSQHAARILSALYDVPHPEALERYRTTTGLPFSLQVAQQFPDHPRNETAIAAFEAIKEHYVTWSRPFPEVPATLTALRGRGDFVAISSNNFQHIVEKAVQAFALPVDLVCGWTGTHLKGPAHFSRVLAASGSTAEAACFVGDSLNDARIATAAALPFVGRAGTFAASEFLTHFPSVTVIHSLKELL